MAALTGRALVAAMCLGQVGNLLPHVAVPAIMAQQRSFVRAKAGD